MLDKKIRACLAEIEQGHVTEGLQSLNMLLDEADAADEWRFEVAGSLYQLGFLAEALKHMQVLYDAYPDEAEVTLTLAEWQMEDDQLDEALHVLQSFTPVHPDEDVRKALLEAEVYRLQGLFEVAEQKILSALDLYEHDDRLQPILHRALGEIYYEQELHALAIRAFKRGLEPPAHILADCHARVGQFEEAMPYYRQALKEQESADTLFGAGFTAYRMEDWEQAVAYWTRLLEADPYYTSAYPRLAEALLKTGGVTEAANVLEKGLTYDETNPALYDMLALLLMKRGDFEQALHLVRQALEYDPVSISLLEKMDEILEHVGEQEARLPYLKQLIDLSEGKPEYHLEKGRVHEQLEQNGEAKDCYKKALEIDPFHPQALNELGFLMRDEGNVKQALVLWEKSLEIDPRQDDIRHWVERVEDEMSDHV